MSQVELAASVNRSRQQISNYISGRRRMSLEISKRIADALGCTIEDLYEWHYDSDRK